MSKFEHNLFKVCALSILLLLASLATWVIWEFSEPARFIVAGIILLPVITMAPATLSVWKKHV